ncbi:MAG: hypothetical protein R3279_09985 [Putridiphycobacter sp.]|nr:hypothetical protein [Putridiphycobacter sp.]
MAFPPTTLEIGDFYWRTRPLYNDFVEEIKVLEDADPSERNV